MSDLPNYETVYYRCQECPDMKSPKFEGTKEMTQHILENHPAYTYESAKTAAEIWADDIINEADQENFERAQFFESRGYDEHAEYDDHQEGK